MTFHIFIIIEEIEHQKKDSEEVPVRIDCYSITKKTTTGKKGDDISADLSFLKVIRSSVYLFVSFDSVILRIVNHNG